MTDVAKLPVAPRKNHAWFERTPTPIRNMDTGVERHERVCKDCKITRTTVIPPSGVRDLWIEWLTDDGKLTIDGPTPKCVPVTVPEVAAS